MNKNVVEFPDRRSLEEEAAAWLVRLDSDEPPSAEDLDDLRAWLERSPAHREELNELATHWNRLNILTELAVPMGHAEHTRPLGFFRRTGWLTSAGAAAVAAAAGLFFYLQPSVEVTPKDPMLATNGLYATAVGQQRTAALADGSTVQLNTNSQLKVEYDSEFRSIRLMQGEAHFTVVENSERPFRVYAGRSRVQAVGTAFSVYLKHDSVDVMVTEGRVALASLDTGSNAVGSTEITETNADGSAEILPRYIVSPEMLAAGQSATIRDSEPGAGAVGVVDVIGTPEDVSRRLAWRDGILMFAGEPLESVVAEINRYTTVSIVVEDPDVRAIRIGGRFPIGETEAMLDSLETNFGLHITRLSHDRVLVSAAP